MDRALRGRAPSIRACGLPIWTVGYPAPSLRRHPRPAIPGKLQRFISRGFLQSHAAYRELAALAWRYGILYDQQLGHPLPKLTLDVEQLWKANATHALSRVLRAL